MRQHFYPIKVALWLAFAGAMTLGFLGRFDSISVASIAFTVCVLTYWLISHRQELHVAYVAREAKPKAIRLGQLKLKHTAPALVLLGLIAFDFASGAIRGEPPSRRERLVYDLLGTPGVVALWVAIGTVLLSFGIETILGARSENET
jgi:hypothetical protein